MEHTTDATSRQAVTEAALAGLPASRADLENLVRIPGVSAPAFDQSEVARSADAVAALLREAGMPEVTILSSPRGDGSPGAPAVVARRPAPAGAPTVLLYAHHDVQPPGDEAAWESPVFEATERNGRLYGRGAADDKAGIAVHLNTIRALLPTWSDNEGVGVTVFIEGEEEIGSPSFSNFLQEHRDLLEADVIIVTDSDNLTVDTPSLTASLRGMTDIDVTVSTLGWAQHSGMNGGTVPDAIMVLTKTLASLWDDAGSVAVAGLASSDDHAALYTEEQLRADTGLLDGVQPIGTGSLVSRKWTQPSITIIGTDAPTIEKSSNTLYPTASARLSLRVAPGQDPTEAFEAVRKHLESNVPFNARIEVTLGEGGRGFAAKTDHPVYQRMMVALQEAWGAEPVSIGIGGSIPFIAELGDVFTDATVLVTGIEDPDARAHGANESLHLKVFERACVAEALFVHDLAINGLPS